MATHSSTLAWRIPMDRGAWRATVHGVAKSRTRPSDFHFHFTFPVDVLRGFSNTHTDSSLKMGYSSERTSASLGGVSASVVSMAVVPGPLRALG